MPFRCLHDLTSKHPPPLQKDYLVVVLEQKARVIRPAYAIIIAHWAAVVADRGKCQEGGQHVSAPSLCTLPKTGTYVCR